MKKCVYYIYPTETAGIFVSPVALLGAQTLGRNIGLTAEPGKSITKDDVNFYRSIIVPESEVELWKDSEVEVKIPQ